ncbi:MAG: Na+/H+ antiporter subunit E [Betaproteobacteria bacterium]
MFHAVSTFVILFAFWLLLSGYFTFFLVAAGAASALAVVAFSRRMDILDREGHPHHHLMRVVFSYWPWLISEIIKSAWDVTRRVLNPRLPISPTLVRFAPSQRSELGLVIHANSITLTPGTISVEVSSREFLVHALTAEGGASLAGSEMDRRVAALEMSH